MQKVRLGIIGIGNMGRAHCKTIEGGHCPDVELAAVADIDPAKLAWVERELPNTVARFACADELIESGTVDAILIAVPHYLHPPIAIKAFENGLHVLTEKPAGVYGKQVREMNEAADKSDCKFAIMWNWRAHPLFVRLKELLDSGKYGEIRRVNWLITLWYRSQAYYDSGDWRASWVGEGGGVLMNQCPHQMDLWQWLCGMPKTVSAKLLYGKWHDIEVEDDATIVVEYENGATGVFVTSTGDAHGTNRLEILLDGAKIVAEKETLTVTEFETTIDEFTYNAPASGEIKKTVTSYQFDDEDFLHAKVLNAFARAILYGEPMYADGREGLNEITLANAAYLSDWLGRPVELPLDEEQYYSELQKRVKTSKKRSAPKGDDRPVDPRNRWRVKW